MSLLDFAKTLRRYWILIVGLTLIGAVLGYTISSLNPERYRSTSSVLVTAAAGNTASELVQGSTYIEKLVASYALLAKSQLVLDPVIDELHLDVSARQLAGSVDATSTLNTVVIDISGSAASPEGARDLVDAVTTHLVNAVRDISPRDGDGEPTVKMTTIESASLPSAPFEPNKRLWAVIGGLGGFVLGLAFALARRLFADTVTTDHDITKIADVPVIGEIPEARRGTNPVQAVLTDPMSTNAEAVRALAANLSFIGVDGGLRTLVVTSGSASESKSTTAAALALTLAENGARVLLIDADLRSPSIADLTGLDGAVGLTTTLIGERTLEESVQNWGYPGLDVLTSGVRAPNPVQLLRSNAMERLVRRAASSYDAVIVDSAPVLHVTDAVWLGHMGDGVLVTCYSGKTRVSALERTFDTLTDANVAVVGMILTRTPRRWRRAYGDAHDGAGVRPPATAATPPETRVARVS